VKLKGQHHMGGVNDELTLKISSAAVLF